MRKHQAAAPKTTRKKKRGNAAYDECSFDPPDDDKMVVEEIRCWDVSASEKTGRVTANRTTLEHYHQMPPSLPEASSTSKRPGLTEEVTDVDETGFLADSESPSEMTGKKRPKRKRTRVLKENDSVSESLVSPALQTHRVSRRRWNSGAGTSVRFF